LREGKRVRAVGQSRCGVVMGLEEKSVCSSGYTSARKRLDKFRLAAAGVPLPAGKLHGMRHVKNNG